MQRGQLLEVTLVNKDIDDGVTIHWHGVDVPNAEDGVAGVTQDAVPPGGRYVYRFRPEQVGTFWYHTHQNASEGVEKGLYGALVIMRETPPAEGRGPRRCRSTPSPGTSRSGPTTALERRAVQAGVPVRLRLINTDSSPAKFRLSGMKPLRRRDRRRGDRSRLPCRRARRSRSARAAATTSGSSNRTGVASVEVVGSKAGLLFSPDGKGEPGAARSRPVFDPASRVRAKPAGLGSRFDRTFQLDDQKKLGFLDGKPGRHWALNGKLYPRVPMFEVAKGDLVRINLVNDSSGIHPMHLHGHHVLVLSRNGKAVAPWSTDTLEMLPHERYTVAFRADNPGLWMLHCHNLDHAADGLSMHLMYAGATTPFRAGKSAHNDPE